MLTTKFGDLWKLLDIRTWTIQFQDGSFEIPYSVWNLEIRMLDHTRVREYKLSIKQKSQQTSWSLQFLVSL